MLERYVQFPEEQVTRVAQTTTSEPAIERLAVEVRRSWGLGLGPIGNVVNLLERHGVVVARVPDTSEDVDAFSTWQAGRPLAFLVMSKESTSRTRWDAAHELGHLVMHADVVPGSPIAEREANRFAAAFLLPKESYLLECPRRLDWDQLYALKQRWKVSVGALVKRAFDLGCLSEASYRRAFIHLNQTGQRYAEPHEPPAEPPTLLAKALEKITARVALDALARELGLSERDLMALVTPA